MEKKRFRLPKALMSEKEKLRGIKVAVYHNWVFQCIIQGKLVDTEGYEAPLVRMLPFLFKCNNIDNFSLFNVIYYVD